jgi:hypothetical protein
VSLSIVAARASHQARTRRPVRAGCWSFSPDAASTRDQSAVKRACEGTASALQDRESLGQGGNLYPANREGTAPVVAQARTTTVALAPAWLIATGGHHRGANVVEAHGLSNAGPVRKTNEDSFISDRALQLFMVGRRDGWARCR